MNDERGVPAIRTATTRRKSWWPGWIWAIPLAAIGIVVWLMLRALSSRGVGVTLVLEDATGMSDNNTKVLYRGLAVGTVSDLALAADGRHIVAHLDIDRDMSPYIHSGTRFYVEGGKPSFSDPASLKALISGPTIELVPGASGTAGRAGTAGSVGTAGPTGTAGSVRTAGSVDTAGPASREPVRRFVAIEGTPPERLAVALPYVVTLRGAVGGIEVGSPVMLEEFPVGEVASTELATDAREGRIDTRVLLWLDPTRFHIEGAAPHGESWSATMNFALAQLIAHGLRASVSQTPPLIGSPRVTLEMIPDAAPAELGRVGGYPAIPAIEGGGLEAFTQKLGRVPIDQIADNVRAVAERLKALSSSPQLDDSIRHLDSALSELDRTVRTTGPQIAPTLRDVHRTVASLRQTAANIDATADTAKAMMSGSTAAPGGSLQQALQELTDAARSIRSLADYLDQHPEALIRGR